MNKPSPKLLNVLGLAVKIREGGGGQGGVLSRSHDSKVSISRITKQKIRFSRLLNMCTCIP